MSYYSDLKPIFASSIMHVIESAEKVKFFNTITYDYIDAGTTDNYYNFLKISKNFNQEITLAWDNLQIFLDQEQNLINDHESLQLIKHCNIYFRDKKHPFIQWLVEFEGDLITGTNVYANYVSSEHLTYPIYSLYNFHQPLKIINIKSSLDFNLNKSNGIIEYYGETGDELEGEEIIEYQI